MITFSKKSWHYNFNKFAEHFPLSVKATDSKSICPYFWKSTYNLVAIIMCFVIIWGLGHVLSLYALGSSDFVKMLCDTDYAIYYQWVFGYLFLGVSLLIMIALSCIISTLYDMKGTYLKKGKGKSPSLFMEWIKAKKAKFCPQIEFKD